MKETLNFFRNKKIFITGHTGFKGSWLTHLLFENGAVLKGYSKEPHTKPSLFYLLELDKKINSIINDINSYNILEKEILDFEPDFIFHLAAQPLVRYSYANTLETHNSNIIGTANVLEATRKLTNRCAVICITTDKVYKNQEWEFPYRETDELGGYDPYSSSKAAAELIISSFRESFFSTGNIQVASVRAGNVIGGGDWSLDRLIPDTVRGISNNEKVEIRNPNSIRPWQHVLDCLNGYLILVDKQIHERVNGEWNFSPPLVPTHTVADVATLAKKFWGADQNWILDSIAHQSETDMLILDSSKAREELNWREKLSFEESISWTVDFYKEVNSGKNQRSVLEKQVNKYQTL